MTVIFSYVLLPCDLEGNLPLGFIVNRYHCNQLTVSPAPKILNSHKPSLEFITGVSLEFSIELYFSLSIFIKNPDNVSSKASAILITVDIVGFDIFLSI